MGQSARLTPATVLVVENEAIVRLELTEWLVENGLIVLTADSADGAIALLDAHPEIELLMTDIKMPGSMDGIRLAHHVRERWPPVKIIVTSGLIDTQPCELPHGAVFMPKPVARPGLWREMANMLGRAEPRSRDPQASPGAP